MKTYTINNGPITAFQNYYKIKDEKLDAKFSYKRYYVACEKC